MTVTYRTPTPEDGEALATMAAASFVETFGQLYAQADLEEFLQRVFGPTGLPSQISDPNFHIHIAEVDGEIAGFAKIGPNAFPGDWPADTTELYQLYVLNAFHGTGIGPALMDWAADHTRALGAKHMILSVWIENHRAQAFYRRRGFREVGKFEFRVGNTVDDDRIWLLDL